MTNNKQYLCPCGCRRPVAAGLMCRNRHTGAVVAAFDLQKQMFAFECHQFAGGGSATGDTGRAAGGCGAKWSTPAASLLDFPALLRDSALGACGLSMADFDSKKSAFSPAAPSRDTQDKACNTQPTIETNPNSVARPEPPKNGMARVSAASEPPPIAKRPRGGAIARAGFNQSKLRVFHAVVEAGKTGQRLVYPTDPNGEPQTESAFGAAFVISVSERCGELSHHAVKAALARLWKAGHIEKSKPMPMLEGAAAMFRPTKRGLRWAAAIVNEPGLRYPKTR